MSINFLELASILLSPVLQVVNSKLCSLIPKLAVWTGKRHCKIWGPHSVFLEMQVCWDLTQHHIPEDLNLHVRCMMIMYPLCTHKQKVEIIRVTFTRDQPIYLYFSINSNYTSLEKLNKKLQKLKQG